MAAYNSSTVQIMHVNFWSAKAIFVLQMNSNLWASVLELMPNASKIGEDQGLKPSMEDDL